jgi:hypothetical protein
MSRVAWYATWGAIWAGAMRSVNDSALQRARSANHHSADLDFDAYRVALANQAKLVRDIFSNPFRPPSLDPSWLSWNDGTIPKLAQAIYDDRAFDRLPILADALEEAGCTNADILNHCRQPGEHVRGCWVVDLLLGKS